MIDILVLVVKVTKYFDFCLKILTADVFYVYFGDIELACCVTAHLFCGLLMFLADRYILHHLFFRCKYAAETVLLSAYHLVCVECCFSCGDTA